ncbi:MAG: VPLPA-CTERM sorting domain-containing protein [Gammaproteobacteria bacterium]|nr:VPLPA-CTERM sorting domain-containing protein [Gammaproteobacteria bacterium]
METHNNVFKQISKIILAAIALLAVSTVQAASVSYYLDQSNDLLDGTNYLQVTISDSTTVLGDIDFSVDVLSEAFSVSPGANFGMQSFSFNFDDTIAVSATDIINLNPATWMISENQNAGGGFFKFDLQLDGTGGSRTELLSFSISGVDGDMVTSYATGSSLNPSSSEYFAAHVAGFDEINGVTSAQFAGSSLVVVPVPAALWLFGSGLIALAGFARSKKR